jgi:hypothetical protein
LKEKENKSLKRSEFHLGLLEKIIEIGKNRMKVAIL